MIICCFVAWEVFSVSDKMKCFNYKSEHGKAYIVNYYTKHWIPIANNI